MKTETLYKPDVIDISKRRKIIKENLTKKLSHKESFKIKNKWIACPIVLLDIDVPIYHLNNGRTRDAQRTYIKKMDIKIIILKKAWRIINSKEYNIKFFLNYLKTRQPIFIES